MTGTGFVALRDLPESDEENEGDEYDETQAESHKQMQAVEESRGIDVEGRIVCGRQNRTRILI